VPVGIGEAEAVEVAVGVGVAGVPVRVGVGVPGVGVPGVEVRDGVRVAVAFGFAQASISLVMKPPAVALDVRKFTSTFGISSTSPLHSRPGSGLTRNARRSPASTSPLLLVSSRKKNVTV